MSSAALNNDDVATLADALMDRPSWLILAARLRALPSRAMQLVGLAFDLGGGGTIAGPGVLAAVPADAWAVWAAVCEVSEEPIVVGKLEDLRYLNGDPVRHTTGRRAASALRELAHLDTWEALDRGDCLCRAIQILVELNQQAELGESRA